MRDGKVEAIFEDLQAAEDTTVQPFGFGRGSCLIRHIGAPKRSLPATALYQPVYAAC